MTELTVAIELHGRRSILTLRGRYSSWPLISFICFRVVIATDLANIAIQCQYPAIVSRLDANKFDRLQHNTSAASSAASTSIHNGGVNFR